MFDFNSITRREDLSFYFRRIGGTSNIWYVYNIADVLAGDVNPAPIAKLNEDAKTVYDINTAATDATRDEIIGGFELFADTRPEYIVGRYIDSRLLADNADPATVEERGYLFDKLLTGAILLQEIDDRGIKIAERCINWLRNTDFYTAPASTRFHESEPGGLVKHTLKVLVQAYQLMNVPTFAAAELSIADVVITALAHDWCKIGKYEMTTRNVKNEKTGVWEKVPCYIYKDSDLPFGHGTSSMFIASKFFRITTEQALALRWHMGRWYVADSDINDLQHSNEKYPLVHLIQFADQLAVTEYAIY